MVYYDGLQVCKLWSVTVARHGRNEALRYCNCKNLRRNAAYSDWTNRQQCRWAVSPLLVLLWFMHKHTDGPNGCQIIPYVYIPCEVETVHKCGLQKWYFLIECVCVGLNHLASVFSFAMCLKCLSAVVEEVVLEEYAPSGLTKQRHETCRKKQLYDIIEIVIDLIQDWT